MNDLFRILELPPEENETVVGEPWRWADATTSAAVSKKSGQHGWAWRNQFSDYKVRRRWPTPIE